jgi:hypothetical protein
MEAAHTQSSEIVDTPISGSRRDTDNDDDEDEDEDVDMDIDAMDHKDTHQASPSDQTLLTQEFASPASASASASSAATRSSSRRRTSRNGHDNGNGSSRGGIIMDNHASPSADTDDHDNNENGNNGNTASSPQCLTQDPDTTSQDQAQESQDDQASPSARINNNDNDVDNNNNNNGGNNNNEANSAASSDDNDDSSEDDDDDENEPNNLSNTLMDRRKLNIQRNQALMNRLDLAYGFTSKRKMPSDKATTTTTTMEGLDNGEEDPEEPTKRRGMLLSTTTAETVTPNVIGSNEAVVDDATINATANADDDHDLDGLASVQSMFSHRQAPIRKLYSVLAAAASQSQAGTHSHGSHSRSRPETTSRFVPAPMFVTGSSGSGKTAILRATVQAIEKGNRVVRDSRDAAASAAVNAKVKEGSYSDGTRVVSAYINCATLDVSSIDELVTHAHNQFQSGIQKLSSGNAATAKTKGRSKRHKKRKSSSVTTDQAGN